VVIVIFSAVAFVIVFVLFFVWLLSKTTSAVRRVSVGNSRNHNSV